MKKTRSSPPRSRRARSASSPSPSRSSDSSSATPSSKSSRSPASTFSRIGSSVESLSKTATLRLPIDDEVGQRLELRPMQVPVEAPARPSSIVEAVLAGSLERPGGGDADEGALERPARQRLVDTAIDAGGEQERQRRRPLAEVDAGDL